MDDMMIVPIVLGSLLVLTLLSSGKGIIGKISRSILSVESCLEWIFFIVGIIVIVGAIFGLM